MIYTIYYNKAAEIIEMMDSPVLYDGDDYAGITFRIFDKDGRAVQANQHVVVHGGEAILLDLGGHKIYLKLRHEIERILKSNRLIYVFLSNQNPDASARKRGVACVLAQPGVRYRRIPFHVLNGLEERNAPMLTLDILRRMLAVGVIAAALGGVLVVECKAAAGAYPRGVAQANLNF